MKLLELYTSILEFCGFTVDEHGFIGLQLDEQKDPAFINGLRMVLPKDDRLRHFNQNEQIVFHPLTENILRGESEVIQFLKKSINIKLNFTIGMVAQELLRVVASQNLHARLTPEQAEILLQIKDCDEKSVTNFTAIMFNRIKLDAERVFTNVYLKRGGTLRDKRHSRVGIVSFPLYSDLVDDKVDKIRVKDNETYRQLFEFMFPNIGTSEEYNFGSDSTVAPYLEALLRTSANVASRLNDLIIIYKEHIDGSERLMFAADWIEAFTDLNSFIPEIRRIPVQNGNDGTLTVVEKPASAMANDIRQQLQAPTAASPSTMVPVPSAPEVKKTRRGIDFRSLTENMAPPPGMAYPMMAPPMMQLPAQMMQPAGYVNLNDPNRMPSWAGHQGQMHGQMPPIQMTPQGPMFVLPNGMMQPVPPHIIQQLQMQQQMPMGGPGWGNMPAAWSPR